jgi:hypothetical protein
VRLNFAKIDIMPDEYHCPACGTTCKVLRVRKEGHRKGWGFINCKGCDRDNPVFRWVYTIDRLTDAQRAAIRRDLFLLLGECDGANARDDVGFNGRDAPTARRYAANLRSNTKIDWVSLASMLRKYRKTQLGGHDDY